MALVPFKKSSAIEHAGERDSDPEIELTDSDEIETGKMSFLEHLDELRKRLILSLAALIVGCIVSFIFLDRVFAFVMEPLVALLPEGGRLTTTEPTEYFMLYLKVGVITGLFVAVPFILLQVWLFVAPGLYAHEKRFAIPFVFFASVFFFIGAAFSHYVAFPWTFKFLGEFTDDFVAYLPRVGPTFALYAKMLLAFAAIFQMPMVVLFLARVGVVTAGFMLRHFKYAVLIIFLLGAVLSPGGDVVSQALMAGPMLILYVISIALAWIFGKKKQPAV
jgi:sec-independent protein translocase protein TatC